MRAFQICIVLDSNKEFASSGLASPAHAKSDGLGYRIKEPGFSFFMSAQVDH
jgi:hypothetical protein